MDEQMLRDLVRQTLARHLQPPAEPLAPVPARFLHDASHYRYALPESDGPCLIEPTVRCNRCGYCESHGH